MTLVKEVTEHVNVSGAIEGRYVVREQRPSGEVVLAPDTSWEAIRDELGVRELTPQEWDELMAKHGSEMLPPDRER